MANEGLASINTVQDAPWNHTGHSGDLLHQLLSPSPTESTLLSLNHSSRIIFPALLLPSSRHFAQPLLKLPAGPQLTACDPAVKTWSSLVDNCMLSLCASLISVNQMRPGQSLCLWLRPALLPHPKSPLWFFLDPASLTALTQLHLLTTTVPSLFPCPQKLAPLGCVSKQNATPVSYTHLTLPTNREV